MVEFANGMAAMAESGAFTDIAVCAGIIGNVDLRLGDKARAVLDANMRAGGGRYRSIRASGVAYDPDPRVPTSTPSVTLPCRQRSNHALSNA
jgi:hypothetical protein